MSWLVHVGSSHLTAPVCRRQIAAFHCSTTVFKAKRWQPKGYSPDRSRRSRRTSTEAPPPEFAREALPHSVAPPSDNDAEVSDGAPTTKNLLRPPKRGKSRWVHDLKAPVTESLRAPETFSPFSTSNSRPANAGYSRSSTRRPEPRSSVRTNFKSERRGEGAGGESSRLTDYVRQDQIW
ncbi:hypothetical protein CPB85DRAFT_1320706 [Mucidula mucida]|nr:hypothetical protein CPB85DRAFT_1320706 [Mucidula mucida]